MNFTVIKVALKTFGKKAAVYLTKNAPKLLVGAGVCGFGAAIVTGSKATLETEKILQHRDEQLSAIEQYWNSPDKDRVYTEEEYKNDKRIVKTQTAWKIVKAYAPTGLVAMTSTMLVFGGHSMLGRRAAAATAAAYKAQTELHKYRDHVAGELGEEVEKRLYDGLAIDRMNVSKKLQEPKQEETKDISVPKKRDLDEFCWCFSEESCGPRIHGSGVWRDDPSLNWKKLIDIQNWCNDRLKAQGYLRINDILIDEFGADGTSLFAEYGWVWDEKLGYDQIDFGLGDINTDEGLRRFLAGSEANVWLRFNVRPEPINPLIDQINQRKRAKRKAWIRH